MLAAVCMSDQMQEVLDCMCGADEAPKFRNPKTGLEFEWTTPPPGFFGPGQGKWGQSLMPEEVDGVDDDDDEKE